MRIEEKGGQPSGVSKETLRDVAPFVGIAVAYILWLAGKLSSDPTAAIILTAGTAGIVDRCIRVIKWAGEKNKNIH